MKATLLKGVVLGAVVSSAIFVAGAAFAGTGVGGLFNLGQSNTVNASTALAGSTNGAALQVTNTNTGANAGGIGISVAPGKPPLRVNSSTKVAGLNADLLDGVDSSGFVSTSHVLHGSVEATTAAGTRVLLDPLTRADVRNADAGVIEIRNRNSLAHLAVTGISTLGTDEAHFDVEILPGATAEFPEMTIEPHFLDLIVTRIGAVQANTVTMRLTCSDSTNSTTGLNAVSCIGLT